MRDAKGFSGCWEVISAGFSHVCLREWCDRRYLGPGRPSGGTACSILMPDTLNELCRIEENLLVRVDECEIKNESTKIEGVLKR